MHPPAQNFDLSIEALSGIFGSVSIACWIVVFSPQIIENFRRGSAEGLSVVFIVIWLVGDIFNILGAVLQGVLPTMIILAIYYTLADVVLLGQLFYYQGFTLTDKVTKVGESSNGDAERLATNGSDEREPLLSSTNGQYLSPHSASPDRHGRRSRHNSTSSFRERLLSIDATHLSPVTPLVPENQRSTTPARQPTRTSTIWSILFNMLVILLVCAAGVLGWYLGQTEPDSTGDEKPIAEPIHFNVLGQIFGYICAALYLGSRIPQLLLNYRRKSTEGISMLFFLFACIGNLSYVLSIFAYEPQCRVTGNCDPGEAKAGYGRYILVNLSWILGSFGTLLLDLGVFVQYFLYRSDVDSDAGRIAPSN